jgi:outer membrane murein-binding lipoprotein Lpp
MKKIIFGAAAVAVLFLSACNSKTGTTAKTDDSTATTLAKNKQTALNSDLAFNKGDIDAAYKDYAADFVEYGDGTSKPRKNIDSLKIDNKAFLVAFPDAKGEKLHAVAEGDTVMITGVWTGTFKKDYRKMKATGKSFKSPDVDIFTFNKDGKITSHSNIQSYILALYQLGVPMPAKKK